MPEEPIILINFVVGEVDVPKYSILPAIGCGGECVFIGRTRPEHHPTHGDLIALSYDCYETMAKKQLETLSEEAIARYSVRAITICHSTKSVEVNGASVVIAVASDHRADAFLACRFLIDQLKLHVPIWKQEVWSDGTTWSEGKPLPKSSTS
ncbi:MAG: molybdenum cofactor biosynthesis protein MoaE [Phycisphaerales bacterium]|jgi:molybdopterin synthase catalytic subunit|nr:molybdenum cofactor biosynthesis protein MoaE [Phycisphaerales bacterium]